MAEGRQRDAWQRFAPLIAHTMNAVKIQTGKKLRMTDPQDIYPFDKEGRKQRKGKGVPLTKGTLHSLKKRFKGDES